MYRYNFHLHSCCHFLGENVFPRFDSWLTNRTPASRSSNLVNHSYDYRPNWTPLGPITFINRPSIVSDIAFFSYYHKNASKYFKNPNHILLFVCLFFNESILKSLGLQAHWWEWKNARPQEILRVSGEAVTEEKQQSTGEIRFYFAKAFFIVGSWLTYFCCFLRCKKVLQ